MNSDMACVDRDPELWFSEKPDDIEYARNICRSCAVIAACLENAMKAEGGLDSRGRYGMYGGLTATERASAHRKQLRANPGTRTSRTNLSQAEHDDRVRMVVDEKLSDREVADIEGVYRDVIYRWRLRHGIVTAHPREPGTEGQRVEMWRAGKSDEDIGLAVGVSTQGIRRWRRARGYGDNNGLPVVSNRDRCAS